MQKLIIETGKKPQFVNMSQEEIEQRLQEIAEAEQQEQEQLNKENQKVLAIERLQQKAKTSQDIADLLEILAI